jgi:hypothetical protein
MRTQKPADIPAITPAGKFHPNATLTIYGTFAIMLTPQDFCSQERQGPKAVCSSFIN